MIVLNDETEKLIKQDIDLGNIVFAGNTIAQYIESKNPHENLTLALKSIKEDLKEILSNNPDYFNFGQVSLNLTLEVLDELGWKSFEGSNNDKHFRCKYEFDNHIYQLIHNHVIGRTIITKIDESEIK